MRAELLHVIVPYFNPIRWGSRAKVHNDFETHMLDSGVNLTTVECAFGDRDFVLDDHPHINRVRVRSRSMLWIKENLWMLGLQRQPEGAKYFGCIDGDLRFRRDGWASEAVHALQHYNVIQPWEHCYDLGPNGEHMQVHHSFARQHFLGLPVGRDHKPYEFAHPGYAWCYTRHFLNGVGGLFDTAILGSADHHMAMALAGRVRDSVPRVGVHSAYLRNLLEWERRAQVHSQGLVGYLGGTIEHAWHGRKTDRRYVDRWQILKDHDFNPDVDIKRNIGGVFEFTRTKPRLIHDMDRYFRQRNEDANTMN